MRKHSHVPCAKCKGELRNVALRTNTRVCATLMSNNLGWAGKWVMGWQMQFSHEKLFCSCNYIPDSTNKLPPRVIDFQICHYSISVLAFHEPTTFYFRLIVVTTNM